MSCSLRKENSLRYSFYIWHSRRIFLLQIKWFSKFSAIFLILYEHWYYASRTWSIPVKFLKKKKKYTGKVLSQTKVMLEYISKWFRSRFGFLLILTFECSCADLWDDGLAGHIEENIQKSNAVMVEI